MTETGKTLLLSAIALAGLTAGCGRETQQGVSKPSADQSVSVAPKVDDILIVKPAVGKSDSAKAKVSPAQSEKVPRNANEGNTSGHTLLGDDSSLPVFEFTFVETVDEGDRLRGWEVQSKLIEFPDKDQRYTIRTAGGGEMSRSGWTERGAFFGSGAAERSDPPKYLLKGGKIIAKAKEGKLAVPKNGGVKTETQRRHVRRAVKTGIGRVVSSWEVSRKQGLQALPLSAAS